MLVNQMKEIQLVAESKILKIDPVNRSFSRYDKTVYIKDPIPQSISIIGSSAQYVEASKFFALFGELKSIELTDDCCHLFLKNGAEYKLPYFMIDWEDQSIDISNSYSTIIKLASGRLSSATLKNLANPILQCIYVDDATAVSCNSMVACIDGTVISSKPLILPPDIISLIEGTETKVYLFEDSQSNKNVYVLEVGDSVVYVPMPDISDYPEIAETLRGSLPENIQRYATSTLFDSLKRLSASHERVVFTGDKVQADEDFEPFSFPTANASFTYSIQNLLSVIQQTKHIAQSDYALLLYGDKFLFMISPEMTEEE